MADIIHDFVGYNHRVGHDFSDLLKHALSSFELELLERVAHEAAGGGLPVYMVGGFPRDLVLGRQAADFDLVVEGDAIALARVLARKYGGKITAHSRFGTAKWDLRDARAGIHLPSAGESAAPISRASLDLVTARRETYGDPAELPTVATGTIQDDLRRRDFTINTLAIRLDGGHFGEVRDDFGALQDLKQGTIRVLHDQSFLDDPTRMYRAVRYEQRYGFGIGRETLELIPPASELVGQLSAQRIRRQLDITLDEDRAGAMLGRLGELGLLRAVHNLLPRDPEAFNRLQSGYLPPTFTPPHMARRTLGWLLWLMVLTDSQIGDVESRLHFTRQLAASVTSASRLMHHLANLSRGKSSRSARYLAQFPEAVVYAVYRAAPAGACRDVLEKYLTQWRHVRLTTSGHDLKRLGLAPGPNYESILRDLKEARIDGQVTTPAEERQRLEAAVRKMHGSAGARDESRKRRRSGH